MNPGFTGVITDYPGFAMRTWRSENALEVGHQGDESKFVHVLFVRIAKGTVSEETLY
jgi:hypothetical protein